MTQLATLTEMQDYSYSVHEKLAEYSATTLMHAAPHVVSWSQRRFLKATDVRIVTLRRQWKLAHRGYPVRSTVLSVHRFEQTGHALTMIPARAYDLSLIKAKSGFHPDFLYVDKQPNLLATAL